jgi:hypothetical protein
VALKNREERVAALIDFGFKEVEAGKPAPAARVLNRGGGNNHQQAADAGETDQQRCAKIQSGMQMIRNRDKCSVDVAMSTLRAEKPDLFPTPENAS